MGGLSPPWQCLTGYNWGLREGRRCQNCDLGASLGFATTAEEQREGIMGVDRGAMG